MPTHLVGDPIRIRQILLNLTGNAIKFTARGRVAIAVSVSDAGEGHAAIVVDVEDTGIGIAAEDQARLFSRFTQVDASTTRKYGGTGLGPAISRHLLELMHGHVSVESAPGGTRFRCKLVLLVADPATSVAAGPRATAVEHQPVQSTAASRPRIGLRVLVVDDNEVNRLVATELLGKLGCEVVEAEDGVAAVRRVAGGGYARAQGLPHARARRLRRDRGDPLRRARGARPDRREDRERHGR